MGLLDQQTVQLRDGGQCPFLQAECIKSKCMLWAAYQRRLETAEGIKHETVLGCSITFVPILLGATIGELQRNQASTDKVATQVSRAGEVIARAAIVASGARARAEMTSPTPRERPAFMIEP